MLRLTSTFAVLCALAAPASAESHASGDAAAGQKGFAKCQACHVVTDDAGNTIAGRSGKTGPNLYGVVGRTAGTVEGFRYGKSLVQAGEAGLVWDQDSFVAYVADPKAFLKAFLDDNAARSKMTFKLRKSEDAIDVYAFLESAAAE